MATLAALLAPAAARAEFQYYGGSTDFASTLFSTEPEQPSSDRPLRIVVSVLEAPLAPGECPSIFWQPAVSVSDRIIWITVDGVGCPSVTHPILREAFPAPVRVARAFALAPLPIGVYTVRVEAATGGPALAETRIEVTAPAVPNPVLALQGERFRVTIDRGLADGTTTPATAERLTDDSGYFWFFDPGNVEVTVKVLDGRPVNGHFWMFAASMTDRPFTLTVMDTADGCLLLPVVPPACPTRKYTALLGRNQNFIDTAAFPLP